MLGPSHAHTPHVQSLEAGKKPDGYHRSISDLAAINAFDSIAKPQVPASKVLTISYGFINHSHVSRL